MQNGPGLGAAQRVAANPAAFCDSSDQRGGEKCAGCAHAGLSSSSSGPGPLALQIRLVHKSARLGFIEMQKGQNLLLGGGSASTPPIFHSESKLANGGLQRPSALETIRYGPGPSIFRAETTQAPIKAAALISRLIHCVVLKHPHNEEKPI